MRCFRAVNWVMKSAQSASSFASNASPRIAAAVSEQAGSSSRSAAGARSPDAAARRPAVR
jgi:hypothetical protein